MEEKDEWMNKLKEKLDKHNEPLPPFGWEQLEKELASSSGRKVYPFHRWTMAAAAAVVLAVVSSLALYFLKTPVAEEMRQAKHPVVAALPDTLPAVETPEPQKETVVPMQRLIAKAADRQEEEMLSVPEETPPVQASPVAEAVAAPVGEQPQPAVQPRRHPSSKDKLHLPPEKQSRRKGTWSMGLSIGNSGGASTDLNAGTRTHMTRVNVVSMASDGVVNIPSDQTLVFEEGVPYLRQSYSSTIRIKHRQPVSVGVSVRKGLPKGFSLETGLTYTLLASDVTWSGSDFSAEQKLHYIGIPLRANWNFLDKKLFTLYVSGGGLVEKCVYGKIGSEKETVKPLQFSVSGAVGAQLNVTKRIGLYVEPGVAYFFNDGSDMQTIRKEHPFHFNLQAGLRLTY